MPAIENKRIVITGANSGIGHEVLKILAAKSGNTIFAVDRNIDQLKGLGEHVYPFQCDVSNPENIDFIFSWAEDSMGGIDIFYANAGFAYYEEMNYIDWNRVEHMFATNVFSPIYSYQKFVKHLNGREGMFAITGSAMGYMGMPGFTLYSASKFAVNGFQEAVGLEKPENVHIITLYPVSTDTGFFKTASNVEFAKPYPLQTPDVVARRMIHGMEHNKRKVMPCRMFSFAMVLFKVMPFAKRLYLRAEKKKFDEWKIRKEQADREAAEQGPVQRIA
jgi:short-subunit dehydrogenase